MEHTWVCLRLRAAVMAGHTESGLRRDVQARVPRGLRSGPEHPGTWHPQRDEHTDRPRTPRFLLLGVVPGMGLLSTCHQDSRTPF